MTLPLLGACTSPFMAREEEPEKIYLLEMSAPAAPAPKPGGPALLVSTPQSAPGFGGSHMIYVIEPHRLDHFARHRWADSPARMLEPLLVRTLESSGLFGSVTGAKSRLWGGLRLDTEVLRLQQAFQGESSEIQLALRVSLVDQEKERLIASEVISVSEPAAPDPYGGVVAANRALGRLLERLNTLLAAQLR